MNPAQFILICAVRMYRWALSPAKTALFGPLGRCRFTPTCSQYALEAIQRHGALRGCRLAARRICRCHPWGDCGHDPVPEQGSRDQAFLTPPSRKNETDAAPGATGGRSCQAFPNGS